MVDPSGVIQLLNTPFIFLEKKIRFRRLRNKFSDMENLAGQTEELFSEIKELIKSIKNGVDQIYSDKHFDSKTGMFKPTNVSLAGTRKN